MARREVERLSARSAATISAVGRHADGANLYLSIGKDGQRRWTFMYKERGTGRVREMGLGPANKTGVSLADARRKATAARQLIADGVDPLTDKRARQAATTSETFGEFADKYVDSISKGFKSQVHIAQWKSSLKDHAALLRPMKIEQIGTEHVLRVLEPIWDKTHETAKRLQCRIERILDAARAKGLRTGDNPARWKGHLKELLAKRKGVREHHAAIPYADMPAFMVELRDLKSVSATALEFAILTAARTGEIVGATWTEIDLDEKLWTIPAGRMKAAQEHRIPLTDRAIQILRSMHLPSTKPGDFVFPGARAAKPLSNMAMLQCLRGIRAGVTVHGFRSAFRDWAGDNTSFPREVAEAALAHVIRNKSEAAYRRSDALNKRRKLMSAWQSFLGAVPGGNVVKLAVR